MSFVSYTYSTRFTLLLIYYTEPPYFFVCYMYSTLYYMYNAMLHVSYTWIYYYISPNNSQWDTPKRVAGDDTESRPGKQKKNWQHFAPNAGQSQIRPRVPLIFFIGTLFPVLVCKKNKTPKTVKGDPSQWGVQGMESTALEAAGNFWFKKLAGYPPRTPQKWVRLKSTLNPVEEFNCRHSTLTSLNSACFWPAYAELA